MASIDPSQWAGQLDRSSGQHAGKLGGYEKPMFEGSNEVQVGGRDHMRNAGAIVRDGVPNDDYGGLQGNKLARGHISFEGSNQVQVAGLDHIQDPRFERDVMRAPEHLQGHMEPWLKKEMLPHIHNDRIKYEGSYEPDVGGRDHFGAGGVHGGWVPDDYNAKQHAIREANSDHAQASQPGQGRPHTPSARYARGEKVTPFHVKRQIVGRDGAPVGRESWDTIKHLPGLTDTKRQFKQVGVSDVNSRFGQGFQRRRQGDIGQDLPRKQAEERGVVKQENVAIVRKKFVDTNTNRNTFNPITGDYYGAPNNPAFQEMITRNEAAIFQDRYTHHVKRPLAGPVENGECSDCKLIPASRTKLLGREGMSAHKAATRGSVKQLFQNHDGYSVPKIPSKPKNLHPLS